MRYVYSIGPGNGIYKWAFWGDKDMPEDISANYEKTQSEIDRENHVEDEIKLPTFSQEELETYTE